MSAKEGEKEAEKEGEKKDNNTSQVAAQWTIEHAHVYQRLFKYSTTTKWEFSSHSLQESATTEEGSQDDKENTE